VVPSIGRLQKDETTEDTTPWNINPSWQFACSIAVEVLQNPDADPEAVQTCRDTIQRAGELAEKYRQHIEGEETP